MAQAGSIADRWQEMVTPPWTTGMPDPVDDEAIEGTLQRFQLVFENSERSDQEYASAVPHYAAFLERVITRPDTKYYNAARASLINMYFHRHLFPYAQCLRNTPRNASIHNVDRALELIAGMSPLSYSGRDRELYLGTVHFSQGHYAEARAAFRQSQKYYLQHPRYVEEMAQSCEQLGPDYADEAFGCYVRLISTHWDRPPSSETAAHAYVYVADYLEKKGQLKAAFMRALAINASHTLKGPALGWTDEDDKKLYDPPPTDDPQP